MSSISTQNGSQDEVIGANGSKGVFPSILRNCMVEGMRGIIGESGTQSVIINWKLEDCMDRPHEFHERLYSVLKQPGTGVIERSIVKELYRAIGEHYGASEQVNFEDSIHLAKRLFLTKEEF